MNSNLLRATTCRLQIVRSLRGSRSIIQSELPATTTSNNEVLTGDPQRTLYDPAEEDINDVRRFIKMPPIKPSRLSSSNQGSYIDWNKPAPKGQVWLQHKKPHKRRFIDINQIRENPPYFNKDKSLEAAEMSKGLYRPHPKVTAFHRIFDEENKARRQLPIPISLTGLGLNDDTRPKFWRHRLRRAIKQMVREPELSSENLVENVTPAMKVLLEKCPDELGSEFEHLRSKYLNAQVESLQIQQSQSMKSASAAEFQLPFALGSNFKQRLLAEVAQATEAEKPFLDNKKSKDLVDLDYDNYKKHHEVIQFFAKGLNKITAIREHEPEMEAWSESLWRRSYGKPDPTIQPSTVPCGGCGANLHCTDASIPGYIPSEKFTQLPKEDLRREQCQRCEFLHHYNVAIDVTVHEGDYPQIIEQIRNKPRALVILMVDLLDFPCSIWPNIVSVFGKTRKIYVVGNKVDLLPKDSKGYLERIELALKKQLHVAGFNPATDTHYRNLSLISAKTGYGVEPLITRLCNDWNGRDDIYLVGCTNVGKSTLFNALLQSDLCAVRENDLVQRATTSVWPGTTLNLLKFPMKRMEGWQLKMRMDRLLWEDKVQYNERRLRRAQFRTTNNPQYAQLSDRIGMTFRQAVPFTQESGHPYARRHMQQRPFDESDKRFKDCKFFHDTPGTIYKDQILTLLTTEELLKTVPREIIQPRSFSLQPLQSLFVGGLGRIDVMSSRQNVLLTVFASQYMPIHVVYTAEAQRFYEVYLGSEMLGVPFGGPERLAKWPQLYPMEFDFEGRDWLESSADIVLSSAGWVSVTIGRDEQCIIKAFTPEARGLFVRKPSLLPYACQMKGRKIKNTPMYESRIKAIDAAGDDGYSQKLIYSN